MGKGGGGAVAQQPVAAEEPVTPAVARAVSSDTQEAQQNQAEKRSRLRGIRSTYSRFASENGAQNGSRAKLG